MIQPLPDKELRELAMDLFKGNVFTSGMLPAHHPYICSMVFMPLALGGTPAKRYHKQIGMIYAYTDGRDKRAPRSINGYPIFLSCRFLLKKQLPALTALYEAIRDAAQKAAQLPSSKPPESPPAASSAPQTRRKRAARPKPTKSPDGSRGSR